MTIVSNNFKAYYHTRGSKVCHDCETFEEAKQLLEEREISKGITPVGIVDTRQNKLVWFNDKMGEVFSKRFIDEFYT